MAPPPVVTKTTQTTTIVIDRGIGRRLKSRCAELGCTMREKVETLLNQWLNETEAAKGRE